MRGYLLDAKVRRQSLTREDGTRWEFGYNTRGEVESGVNRQASGNHRSSWREGQLLLNLIKDATWPELKIAACLDNWNRIQRDLAEGRRNRIPRIKTLLS